MLACEEFIKMLKRFRPMAAGMSSRYGSLKQIDPVDEEGHIIIDFSVFDAHRAGFDEVIFLIKKNISGAFHAAIGDRAAVAAAHSRRHYDQYRFFHSLVPS